MTDLQGDGADIEFTGVRPRASPLAALEARRARPLIVRHAPRFGEWQTELAHLRLILTSPYSSIEARMEARGRLLALRTDVASERSSFEQQRLGFPSTPRVRDLCAAYERLLVQVDEAIAS